jgi:hypothetical protein
VDGCCVHSADAPTALAPRPRTAAPTWIFGGTASLACCSRRGWGTTTRSVWHKQAYFTKLFTEIQRGVGRASPTALMKVR